MFHTNIEKETIDNDNYRKVLNTTCNMQLVVMSLKPNETIPNEIHHQSDQFIRIEEGSCRILINKRDEIKLNKDDCIIIPKNTYHEVINGDNKLKLYTIYAQPQHPNGWIQKSFINENNDMIDDIHGGYRKKYERYEAKNKNLSN